MAPIVAPFWSLWMHLPQCNFIVSVTACMTNHVLQENLSQLQFWPWEAGSDFCCHLQLQQQLEFQRLWMFLVLLCWLNTFCSNEADCSLNNQHSASQHLSHWQMFICQKSTATADDWLPIIFKQESHLNSSDCHFVIHASRRMARILCTCFCISKSPVQAPAIPSSLACSCGWKGLKVAERGWKWLKGAERWIFLKNGAVKSQLTFCHFNKNIGCSFSGKLTNFCQKWLLSPKNNPGLGTQINAWEWIQPITLIVLTWISHGAWEFCFACEICITRWKMHQSHMNDIFLKFPASWHQRSHSLIFGFGTTWTPCVATANKWLLSTTNTDFHQPFDLSTLSCAPVPHFSQQFWLWLMHCQWRKVVPQQELSCQLNGQISHVQQQSNTFWEPFLWQRDTNTCDDNK